MADSVTKEFKALSEEDRCYTLIGRLSPNAFAHFKLRSSNTSDYLRAGLASEEVAAAARIAPAAVPGIPADADTLARLPARRDILADGINLADHLVPRDARVGDAEPMALLGHDVAVANPACQNLDPYHTGSWIGDRPFDKFQWATGA